jgi:hypothetical protein
LDRRPDLVERFSQRRQEIAVIFLPGWLNHPPGRWIEFGLYITRQSHALLCSHCLLVLRSNARQAPPDGRSIFYPPCRLGVGWDIADLYMRRGPVLGAEPHLEYTLRTVAAGRTRPRLYRLLESNWVARRTTRPGNIDRYPRRRNVHHVASLATATFAPEDSTITSSISTNMDTICIASITGAYSTPGAAPDVCNSHIGSVAPITPSGQPTNGYI